MERLLHNNMPLHIYKLLCLKNMVYSLSGGNSKHSLILLFVKDINRGVQRCVMTAI
jgi:hypothetical protein